MYQNRNRYNQYQQKHNHYCPNTYDSYNLSRGEIDYNEKYFRPSKYPSLNTLNLFDVMSQYDHPDPYKIELPAALLNSPQNTLINFFSILREANQDAYTKVGCGSVGSGSVPYPIAYDFLSNELKNSITYEEFLDIFKKIYHINLIVMYKLPSSNGEDVFFMEFETIEGTSFSYYYGYFKVIKEDSLYKINSLEFVNEDFFCAPYHGWQHNAEARVETMYGGWCNLIAKKHPTLKEGPVKKITIDGTDGNQYMFVFIELTNGTDIEVAQYMKTKQGDWKPIQLDPSKCLNS